MLPLFYEKIGFTHFFLSFFLFSLLLTGILSIWLSIRKRLWSYQTENILFEFSAAVVIAPFLIFPFHFIFSLYGFYRWFLVCTQVILIFFGLRGFIKNKLHKIIIEAIGKPSLISTLCLLTVALFIYWPFVMPYSESFNGHHHILMNMISWLWKKGAYTIIPPQLVCTDNDIFLWPANLAFFLTIFSFPYIPCIGEHILYMVPGILSFFTWQLFRYICQKIEIDIAVGDFAFLAVAFSYFGSLDFSAIHFDLFTPFLCVFFLLIFIEVFLNKKTEKIPFIVLMLAFSFLVRKQLFLMFFSILLTGVLKDIIATLIKRRHCIYQKINYFTILVFIIPAVIWSSFVFYIYGSPFFPHGTSFTARIFKINAPPSIEPYLIKDIHGGPNEVSSAGNKINALLGFLKTLSTYKYNSNVNFYIENFLPLHLNKGILIFIKNFFCGLSVSGLLMLGYLGFFLIGINKKSVASKYIPIAFTIIIGYISAGIIFFLTYPKYPHYLSYLIALFSSIFYFFVARELFKKPWLINMLALILFVNGIVFWGYNLWGHSYKDKTFENVRFLWPYYKTPLDRLARESNRSKEELMHEINELTEAKDYLNRNHGLILYMEHEPGALIPALLDRDCLADVIFFRQSLRNKDIYRAKTKEELLRALRQLDIKFVYRPGRSHRDFDYTVLLNMIAGYQGKHKYIIPVEELIK